MPTLQEVTAAHSQRLSALHRRRDQALADAQLARDSELRALPAAVPVYARYDKSLAAALEDRTATEHKAGAARQSALARAVDERAAALAEAHATRRAADLEALNRKARATAAAEEAFREAMVALGSTTALDVRQKLARDADKVRQRELAEARDAYAAAIDGAQHAYRAATNSALTAERAAERVAEQAHHAARRVAAASDAAAAVTAERELFRALQAIPEARDAVDRYRDAVTRIRAQAGDDEQALFQRFRQELSLVA
jgi:hypothetical protein